MFKWKSLQGSHRRSCENVDFVVSPPAIEIRIRVQIIKIKKGKKKGEDKFENQLTIQLKEHFGHTLPSHSM